MILNQRQLGISRKKRAELMTYREEVAERENSASQMERDAIDEVLADLEREINAYERLADSHPSQVEVRCLGDLP